MEQFVAGEDSAFDELVRRYYKPIYRFLVRFVGRPHAAEDLTQETFIKLHQSAATFDVTRRFKPWVFAVAGNKARDALRSAGRAIKTVDIHVGSDSEEHSLLERLLGAYESPAKGLIQRETSEKVKSAIQLLPDHFREVLILAYYQQFQYKEIAEMLGIPLGTVKSRLHKAVIMFGTIWKSKEHGHE